MNLLRVFKEGLAKTRQAFTQQITGLIGRHKNFDDNFFEELEEILLTADVGMKITLELVGRLKERVRREKLSDPGLAYNILQEEVASILDKGTSRLREAAQPPTVILVVGVNGSGKTTTIGKLAYQYKLGGKKVILAAADTFRAAAGEQLGVWAQRAGAELIRHQEGADPAAVAFDAIQAARSRRADVVLIDTAGRLQSKVNLMEELKKIQRVIAREIQEAPHEVLLVLDATTGQNGLSQARIFREAVGVTGIVLTKLDGTAKGGVVLAIGAELGLPVKLVGLGEKITDLREFSPQDYAAALFSR
ncbi:MAG: fused signal recognition particle receptor [Clostridia bacterium]|nr:fused signal recognition particle receptor [Clostridia bacterium]